MVFRISIGLNEILESNKGLKKNLKIRIRILKKEVYALMVGEIRKSYLEVYVFLKGNKVRILSREIEINGFGLGAAMREVERYLDFRNVKTVMFKDQPHVIFLSQDGKKAFILTTRGIVEIGGKFVGTKPLSSERLLQKYLFSSIEENHLMIKNYVQTSHFYNNK